MDGYREMGCPHCGHVLRVRAGYAGRRVRCAFCGETFDVPDWVEPSSVFPKANSDGFALPDHEILGVIGDGSMGRVYKARQAGLGRIVAVKVLREGLAGDPEYVRRFRNEAQIASRLSHENVVHFLQAGEIGGRPYLVMEYAEGRTVQDRLDDGEVFDERTALRIALAVAAALDHARRRGLVHRDVKPSNIVLAPGGGVKLLDLGLARPLADAAWARSEAGNPIGTPEYISPEQVRGLLDVDARSDIYALGATLYHMLTGRVLYRGTTVEVLRQHVDRTVSPVPPRELNPGIGRPMEDLILRMIAKDRDQRPPTPDALILAMRRVLLREPAGPSPPVQP